MPDIATLPPIFHTFKSEEVGIVVKDSLTLTVYDCVNRRWTDKQITVRNTQLNICHPTATAAIGAIPVEKAKEEMLRDFEKLSLDFASGSRTHGYFTFTNGNIGGKYFGKSNSMGRINYGSLLMTECRVLYALKDIKIEILEEDSAEGKALGLGDSHGKISPTLLAKLSVPADPNPDDPAADQVGPSERDTSIPIQFRLTVPNVIIAKGTLAAEPKVTERGVDLILPKSCFKAKKPDVGVREKVSLVLGVVFEAEDRSAKGGQMLWQWYSKDALATDVLPYTLEEAEKLSDAVKDIHSLAAALSVKEEIAADEDFFVDDQNLDDPEEGTSRDYRDVVLEVVIADKFGQLTRHPYLVQRVRDRLRKRWVRLALNGAVIFRSLMYLPLDTIGEHVFIAYDLPVGSYIIFRNPVRHWGDIKIWKNIKSQYADAKFKGVAMMSHTTAAQVAGDFDGDFGQFDNVNNMKVIAKETKEFPEKYKDSLSDTLIEKPGKKAITGSLAAVAIRSMDSKVGLVANLIMRAQATSTIAYTVTIKNWSHAEGKHTGGETTMTVLEFLGQELQIAVDRLKNDLYHDDDGIKQVQQIVNSLPQPPWIDDRKKKEVYLERPMYTRVAGGEPTWNYSGQLPPDSVSFMIDEVNQRWVQLSDYMEHVSYYRNLFPNSDTKNAPYTADMIQAARNLNQSYGKRMAQAAQLGDAGNFDEAKKLRESVFKDIDAYKEKLVTACTYAEKTTDLEGLIFTGYESGVKVLEDGTLVPATLFDWCCAFWDACHGKGSSELATGGLVFRMFPDQIIEQLDVPGVNQVRIIGCSYYELKYVIWGDPDAEPQIEKGKPSVILAKPNPNNPLNRFLMQPKTASNVVMVQFVNSDQGILVNVRSSSNKPWIALGTLVPEQKWSPTLGKPYKAAIYTSEISPAPERGKVITRSAVVVWQS